MLFALLEDNKEKRHAALDVPSSQKLICSRYCSCSVRERLRKMFDEAKARDPETQVVVQADEATHHGRVVAVMELAKAAGLRRLAIATRRR